MGSSNGGSSGSQTVTQKADPWAGQQPYLTGGDVNGSAVPGTLPEAAKLYQSGALAPSYYGGQTVADQSPYTQQAIQQLATQANSPQTQGLANAETQQVTDTLNGKYLDPRNNPGFQQSLDDAQKAYSTGTAAQTDAAFNRSGSYGGSAYDETKTNQNKAYGDSINTLLGNEYDKGRTNQLQAASLAPQANTLPYANIGQLATAGSTQDAYNQSLINAGVQKYNYNSNLPYNALSNYAGLVSGNYGSSSTQTTPYTGNSLAANLGLGIGALNAGSNLYSSGALNGIGSSLSSLWGSGASNNVGTYASSY